MKRNPHFLFSITAWKYPTNSMPPKAKIFSFYSANFHSHFFSLPQLDPIYITMNSNKQSTRRRDIRTKGEKKKKTLKYKTMEELPPGYRFFPTEEELVSFYLINKLEELCGEKCQGDTEQWFFFTPRQEREERGGRPSRTTASGYWKATGSPSYVYSSDNRVIGVKKTMVFYKGKAPTGRKTKWKMHEYRAIEGASNPSRAVIPKLRHEFSLCRIYVKSESFRAFDRRPLEAAPREEQPHGGGATTSAPNNIMVRGNGSNTSFQDAIMFDGDVATTSAQNNIMGPRASSPETSYSGEDHSDYPETNLDNNWNIVADPQPPLWDWEQLNWA